ncbi:hypothetical protein MNBD_GAMMA09-3820 [hydrothermal vent metagenome]|uniref:histidine kinase n=1 Tax=hydrothermal vent metagenome TaxID=652676 RepID=A0A3B0XQR3_9ZZZZ
MSHSVPVLQSLRCRLIVSVVAIEVIMLSILVWNNILIIQTTHTDRLRDTAQSMIEQIANTSGRYMVEVDYASLEDYLKNVINYKELLYLAVLDRDGSAVISLGPYLDEHRPLIDRSPAQVGDGVFDIAQSIEVAGQPMGEIRMGFSLAIMQDAINKSRIRGIAIAAIEINLTVFVTIIIGLGLTRRLAVLSDAAEKVEAGDYSIKIPIESNDEVGKTALAFNRMVTEVSSRTQQLEKEQFRARELLIENRQLIHTSLEIQEEERKYLARELHDELGQCLTAIQADAELIRDSSQGDKRVLTSAVAIMDVSSRVYDVVHSMMHRLRPSILDNLGLVEALKDEIEAWSSRNIETHCEFNYSAELQGLGGAQTGIPVDVPHAMPGDITSGLSVERISITLYRIVQECLTNISKHAQAKNVSIELLKNAGSILLTVTDDGVGFDMPIAHKRLGLIGMRERVNSLGGSMTLNSVRGKGVAIAISVPLTVGLKETQ